MCNLHCCLTPRCSLACQHTHHTHSHTNKHTCMVRLNLPSRSPASESAPASKSTDVATQHAGGDLEPQSAAQDASALKDTLSAPIGPLISTPAWAPSFMPDGQTRSNTVKRGTRIGSQQTHWSPSRPHKMPLPDLQATTHPSSPNPTITDTRIHTPAEQPSPALQQHDGVRLVTLLQ